MSERMTDKRLAELRADLLDGITENELQELIGALQAERDEVERLRAERGLLGLEVQQLYDFLHKCNDVSLIVPTSALTHDEVNDARDSGRMWVEAFTCLGWACISRRDWKKREATPPPDADDGAEV